MWTPRRKYTHRWLNSSELLICGDFRRREGSEEAERVLWTEQKTGPSWGAKLGQERRERVGGGSEHPHEEVATQGATRVSPQGERAV